jgi:MscS family membrane protein
MDVHCDPAALSRAHPGSASVLRCLQFGQRALLVVASFLLLVSAASAQDSAVTSLGFDDERSLFEAPRTDSPRHTLSSFLRLTEALELALTEYRKARDRAGAERIALISEELISLVDLSEVPAAARREVAGETVGYLLDIFGRLSPPDLSAVPDATAFAADGSASYAIPETPLRIQRIEEGQREGEFLFSARTVRARPGSIAA